MDDLIIKPDSENDDSVDDYFQGIVFYLQLLLLIIIIYY